VRTYSFRAECSYDALRFLTQATEYAVEQSLQLGMISFKNDPKYPDVEVEFKSTVELSPLREVVRGIEDCHVILQTLRPVPLSMNSLKRDTNIH
jgi:hypothetical protein